MIAKDKKRQKVKKLKPQTISKTMPSQNRLALEHMLEFEEEPSEEFKSSVAALPVDLVKDPNQFPIFTNADRALPVDLVSDPN